MKVQISIASRRCTQHKPCQPEVGAHSASSMAQVDSSRFEDSVRKLVQRAWAGNFDVGPKLAEVQAKNKCVVSDAAA